jgi:hypothetical protein
VTAGGHLTEEPVGQGGIKEVRGVFLENDVSIEIRKK